MKYIVVIPTYKRYEILKHRTLNTLMEHNINPKSIYIFVANEKEKEEYKKTLDKKTYHKIIVGVKGLKNQREFISQSFPENTNIISFDDDIESIDLSLNTLPFDNLHEFFIYAFQLLRKKKLYIWGLYPVYNPFFRKDQTEISYELKYIVGAIYGFINRHSNDLTIHVENKEDVERTILYYIKDGGVIRFNRIGFVTKYYGKVGGMGTFEDRLKPMETASKWLLKKYPDYGKIKVRKNGMTEFVLHKLPYQNNKNTN